MGSVPNCQKEFPMHDAIRWFKPPKKGTKGFQDDHHLLCPPAAGVTGREGTEGISILGFRVPTICRARGREGSEGE